MDKQISQVETIYLTNLENGRPAATPSSEEADSFSSQFNEQTNYLPPKRVATIFLVCASVDFVALMDQTTLAASLYMIGDSFSASSQNSWITAAYFMTSTSFQLIYGRLSDIWGRKIVLLSGLAIFFIGSLTSSLASNVTQLIGFRALTGVGGGCLMTVSNMILGDIVPLRSRGKYHGIWGAFIAVAHGTGPIVGGALAVIDWKWIFRLNMLLTIIPLLGIVFYMPLKKVEAGWKLKLVSVDFIGVGVALASMSQIVFGLTAIGRSFYGPSVAIVAVLISGILLFMSFFLWQWKGASLPLVPIRIFRGKIVNGCSIINIIIGWNFFVSLYYIPSFYQLLHGYSPMRSGSLILPITVIQTFSSTLSGLVITAIGRYRECILCGWALWAIGLGLYSTIDIRTGLATQVGYATLTGFGVGMTLQPSLVAIQAAVDRRDMGVVTSFRGFCRNLGATLGLTVTGTILNRILVNDLKAAGVSPFQIQSVLNNPKKFIRTMRSNHEFSDTWMQRVVFASFTRAFRAMFLLGSALAVVAFFVTLFFIPNVELIRADEAELREEGQAFDNARKQARRKGKERAEQEPVLIPSHNAR